MQNEIVTIYTDGACRGNPGLGSYAAILSYKSYHKEISGIEENTTNNRMELRAVIEALKILKRKCTIQIYTDSQYVQKGITEWIHNWRTKNYKNIKNSDLWQELDMISKQHNITWNWVRGHNGNVNNELADKLANIALDNYLTRNKDVTNIIK